MSVEKYNYEGNTNTGFYITTSNKQSIIPPGFDNQKILGENVCETFIARTRLVGLFTAGNSNCILIPNNITQRERENLEQSEIDFKEIKTQETALGNQILANDKGAIISKNLEKHKENISDALKVPVKVGEVAGIKNVGSAATTNNRGSIIHREASEKEAEKLKNTLKLENIDIGTINTGSPFIGSGAAANNTTVLLGEDSTGPEIGRIDRTMIKHE